MRLLMTWIMIMRPSAATKPGSGGGSSWLLQFKGQVWNFMKHKRSGASKIFLADRFILSLSYNAESRDRQMWAAMQPFHFTDIGMCSIISPDMVFKDKVFILCSIKQRLCKNG